MGDRPDGRTLRSVDPATGRTVAEYEGHTDAEMDRLLERACLAGREWGTAPPRERARLLFDAADLLESRARDLAHIAAREMGKPVTEGRAEVRKCASVCRYYAENGERFLAPEPVETEALRSYVARMPRGVVLAVMPWNFPYWQLFRFGAPCLMAGNAILLKHSPNVTGCALAAARLLEDAGMPDGLCPVLLVPEERVPGVTGRLVADRRVDMVTLTGSTRAGTEVGAAAGRSVKRSVLELGGSDPAIVLRDADLELAASEIAASRLVNTGQSCIAAKRIVVVESVLEELTERLVAEMRSRTMGDPVREDVDLGPLARKDLREELDRQVLESVSLGAGLAMGGETPAGPGAFYPATVLTGVSRGMPAFDEETFGPVAAVCPAANEEEALSIARDTPYGLGASVFTRDTGRGEAIALRIRAGACFVNAMVRSDPRLPFGGTGASGYGRELGREGVLEMTECRTVYVSAGRPAGAPAEEGRKR